MKSSVSIVGLALVAFTLGWYVGHSSGVGGDHNERIAKLERQMDAMLARGAANAPGAAGPAARPVSGSLG